MGGGGGGKAYISSRLFEKAFFYQYWRRHFYRIESVITNDINNFSVHNLPTDEGLLIGDTKSV